MRTTVFMIVNPAAGSAGGRDIDNATRLIKAQGYALEVLPTSRRGDAERFAKGLAHRADTLVIAAGGDGTYNEVANGLVNSDTPMAIIPLGTTSVLAHELAMPLNVTRAVSVALGAKTSRISLGRITLLRSGNSRYFLLMAGVGHDAEAVRGISQRVKTATGAGAYVLSGLKAWLKYDPAILRITGDGNLLIDQGKVISPGLEMAPFSIAGYAVIAGKAAYYGGPFNVTPDARLTDDALYLFVTHGRSRMALLRYAVGILLRRHLSFKDISYLRASVLEIQGDSHVQIDGDYAGRSPVRIDVVKEALNLVVP